MEKVSTTQENGKRTVGGVVKLEVVHSWRAFASVKLTVSCLTLIAATVLLGAWCPQEAAGGQEKVIEQFGEEWGMRFIQWGIADIFHSPWFLGLIATLTINMVACSVQRVFPKVRLLRQPMPFLAAAEIGRLPYYASVGVAVQTDTVFQALTQKLRRQGYVVRRNDNKLTAEFGKFAKLAATVTHIGLLTLLVGVTISSWTGFSGFKPVRLGEDLTFGDSEHSKLWIGKLPAWRVHVDATRREDYDTGEAKQWYSDLSVLDPQGHILAKGQISVNNPLTYGDVDVYQSSWGIDKLLLSFNGHQQRLSLRPMGKRFAAFLPLDPTSVMIFSVKNQHDNLRIFAKRPDWSSPHLLVEVPPGGSTQLGGVTLRYDGLVPLTGLQYKSDPGLPTTYVAFGFIMLGVLLATVPHRLLWASVTEVETQQGLYLLSLGGRSAKSKTGFERSMNKLMQTIETEFGGSDLHSDDVPPKSGKTDSSVNEASKEPVLVGGKTTHV